ncbi:aldehyde dehydrogenase, partial [Micromonospora sp. NPDC049799]
MESVPFFVASRPVHGEEELTVHHPYDGRAVGRTTLATADQVEAAVAAAAGVAAETAALPAHA